MGNNEEKESLAQSADTSQKKITGQTIKMVPASEPMLAQFKIPEPCNHVQTGEEYYGGRRPGSVRRPFAITVNPLDPKKTPMRIDNGLWVSLHEKNPDANVLIPIPGTDRARINDKVLVGQSETGELILA